MVIPIKSEIISEAWAQNSENNQCVHTNLQRVRTVTEEFTRCHMQEVKENKFLRGYYVEEKGTISHMEMDFCSIRIILR